MRTRLITVANEPSSPLYYILLHHTRCHIYRQSHIAHQQNVEKKSFTFFRMQ